MKVYLDDIRPTPYNWFRTFTVEQTIDQLKSGKVNELSLDDYLGACTDCGGDIPLIEINGIWVPAEEPIFMDSIPPDLELDFNSGTLIPDSKFPTARATIGSNEEVIIPAPPLMPHIEQEEMSCRHIKNGYNVILWLERAVGMHNFVPPEKILVHSDNSALRKQIEIGISSVYKFHQINLEEKR